MVSKRRPYKTCTGEFKQEAVRLMESGERKKPDRRAIVPNIRDLFSLVRSFRLKRYFVPGQPQHVILRES